MAWIEIERASGTGTGSVYRNFSWITIEPDSESEDVALEWKTERGFCFRVRDDVARQMAALLMQAGVGEGDAEDA